MINYSLEQKSFELEFATGSEELDQRNMARNKDGSYSDASMRRAWSGWLAKALAVSDTQRLEKTLLDEFAMYALRTLQTGNVSPYVSDDDVNIGRAHQAYKIAAVMMKVREEYL